MSRTIDKACASSSARWSTTPEVRACRSPPPSSSAVTSSPVAAFTSGGAPGEDGPPLPAVHAPPPLLAHRRHVGPARGARAEHGRDLRDAGRRHLRLVVEDAPEVLPVGEHVV